MLSSQKKRKVEDSGDSAPNQNSYANAKELGLDLINQMNLLTIETDNLNRNLPEQFDQLLLTLKKLPQSLKKLTDRMEIAKMRSWLDPDQIQTVTQFGVNPLYLTEKFTFVRGQKRKDWSHVTLPSTYQVIALSVENVSYDGVLYPNLTVKCKKYANCSGVKGNPHLFECPFSPVCDCYTTGPKGVRKHITYHFNAPVFFCFCCRVAVFQKWNLIGHFKLCMSHLTNQAEIDKVVEICKEKLLGFSDFRTISQQLWNDNKINLALFDKWSSNKFNLFVDYFEFFFRLPPLDSRHQSILSLNTEFAGLISSLCEPSRYGNDAEIYAVFETTGKKLTMMIAPSRGKYVGSQCETVNRGKGRNKIRHQRYIEDEDRKILVKNFSLQAPAASCDLNKARHTFEDSLKVMFDALSEDLWNMYAVSRNETNNSYSWPVEKRMLFGFHMFRHQWDAIKAGLADQKNIL